MPIWDVEANDLIELAGDAERAAKPMDERGFAARSRAAGDNEHSKSLFAAEFLGESNRLKGTVIGQDDTASTIRLDRMIQTRDISESSRPFFRSMIAAK